MDSRVARIDALLDAVEALEPHARETATELAQTLLEVHGDALARIAARCEELPLQDELVAHLLVLHGLHPVALETRVRGALDEVRPYLRQHGGGVELLGVEEGVVRLRLDGACHGCPSSAVTLKSAVEEAVRRAAPEVERIEADGGMPEPGLLQIEIACPVPRA
jgi:Fe-S cluster biogenesis protein NfuA